MDSQYYSCILIPVSMLGLLELVFRLSCRNLPLCICLGLRFGSHLLEVNHVSDARFFSHFMLLWTLHKSTKCQNACLYGGLGGHECDSYTLMGYLLIWSNQYKWDLNLDLSDRILSTSLIT